MADKEMIHNAHGEHEGSPGGPEGCEGTGGGRDADAAAEPR
jgi:hypothetical protein